VNCIADYYGVTDLAELSAEIIKDLLDKSFSVDAFCLLLDETINSTGDKNLQEVLVQACVANISQLMDKDIFAEGGVANSIAPEVLKAFLGDFQNNKLKQEKDLEAVKMEANKVRKNLDELAIIMSPLRRWCGNARCRCECGVIIERPERNAEKRYLVYCKNCGSCMNK
jgi:hypothetical protein